MSFCRARARSQAHCRGSWTRHMHRGRIWWRARACINIYVWIAGGVIASYYYLNTHRAVNDQSGAVATTTTTTMAIISIFPRG